MPTAEYDLRYLSAGLEQLESYLLSKDLYRPIGINAQRGETPYPQLTLGWMLLSRKRAEATATTPSQLSELARLGAGLDEIHSRWRTAWGKKAAQEFRSRVKLWGDFLEEYRRDPRANANRYAYEVNRRVLLDILQPEAEALEQADQDLCKTLDGLLQSVFQAGEFVWDTDLTPAFPRQKYWYLYGNLTKVSN